MRYFINKDGQIASLTRQDLIDNCLTEGITYDEQGNAIGELVWQEITETEYAELTKVKVPTQEEIDKQNRIAEIKTRLDQLSEDIVQHNAGEIVPDYPERLEEFRTLHNELRVLEGKEPRQKQIQL